MSGWMKNVRKVTPYIPGEQPKEDKVIKLNTNENPYDPAPGVLACLNDIRELRMYPDPASSMLNQSIAEYYGVNLDQVFTGVGSDDVLAMAFLTFFNADKPVLFPDITYSFYEVWAELFRIPYEKKALDNKFHLVKEDYFTENGGIIFPNPNAPTGCAVSLDFIEEVAAGNRDSVVIIDEAYIDFGAQSALPLIDKYDNLLVVQTFSKSRSMAGIRIGYAMGSKALIQALHDVKYSFNSYTMNQTSIYMGAAAIQDRAYLETTIHRICTTREWFSEEMRKLGFEFEPSMTNFIFASHPEHSAKDIFEAARQSHIYVRYFNKPRIDNYLRITIGTDQQMEVLAAFLRHYLKK